MQSDREMRDRIAAFDWSHTPLGAQESWPQSLKSHVKILLASRYPMILTWGPEFTQIYNDAYARIIGDKHPGALGTDIRVTLAEAWDTLGPLIAEVMATGTASWVPALLLPLERSGYREESYFSVSHAAAEDDAGQIVGMLAVCSEVTQQVIGDRRLRLLSDLGARAGDTRGAESICRDLAAALAEDPLDVPFALIYLRDADGRRLTLCGAAGLPEGGPASPRSIDLAEDGDAPWPLARAAAGETVVANAEDALTIPGGPWGEPVRSALVMPVASPDPTAPLGVLVVGVSPNRALDEGYRSFHELLAGQISVALRNARAHEEERRRAEMLAELDRAKTTFFSNVSHELRTPLTLILGPIEESLQDSALPPERREALEVVQRNALRLLKLVNTLLDFSRIEAGRIQARYEPTDLAAFTADLAGVFRSAVERAGLKLAVDCPPLAEPVYVDRDMWEKIVLNLVSNAFKFTESGRITVRQSQTGEAVELAVEDTGCGIPAAELARVFERFHRIEGTRGRSHEGTGIGLSLVQELVRLHGGTVTAQSQEGRGSSFTVTVPLGRRHLPAEHVGSGPALTPTSIRTEAYALEALHWLPEEAPASTEAMESAGPRPRVLLADDNADMREYVRKLLSPLYEVVAVPDGEAAWAAVEERQPDLLLSDVMMPRLDGFGLLARLRADPRASSLPVILLSARAGEEARVEGLQAGADDYLIKPFGARELLARVAATLERARLREESALARNEARTAAERAALLESITDCFYALDREWRFTYINGPCETYYGMKREELLGRVLWEAFPVAVGSDFEEQYRRAVRDQAAVHFEVLSPLTQTWLEVHAYPSSGGLSVNFRDITRRQEEARLREELLLRERAARHQAEEASRLKDEFLSTVSHELRTPLNAVLGWTQLLRQRGTQEPGAAGIGEGLEVIERNARAQAKLIEDLLDLGRIISGKVRLDAQSIDLAGIARAAVETMQPTADVKGIRLSAALAPDAGRMVGDPNRLHQVISNLLSNALKFTPKGGEVLVSLERTGSSQVLTLADTGIGIEPDFLPYVFDRFRQADGSTTRRHGGLGIGLSIVKNLVELHGGSVQVHSEGRDRGTTFVVHLPVAAVQPRTGESGRTEEPAAEEGPRLSAKKILVVDDEADARELVRHLLEEREAEVATASSGTEALQLLLAFRPDVLVSDIGMPGLDGYELIQRIRAIGADQGGAVPAVALTALARKEDRTRALLAGYQAHVAKPVEPAELIATVASLAGLIGKTS